MVEHHLAAIAHADWIIDLGPGAGHDGGRVVCEGTPADLVAARSTLTGQHLAALVGNGPEAVRARRQEQGRAARSTAGPPRRTR